MRGSAAGNLFSCVRVGFLRVNGGRHAPRPVLSPTWPPAWPATPIASHSSPGSHPGCGPRAH